MTSLTISARLNARFTSLLISLSVIAAALLSDLNSSAAQSLDIKLDSSVSSGLMIGPNGREVSLRRAPLYLDFDAIFIFDGDQSIEWVLGSILQTEYTPGFAFNPQVRLRRKWSVFEMFAGVGLPFFIQPYTRFGTELSLGGSMPTSSSLALIGQVSVQTFFMGSDLPDDHTVISVNGSLGVRMRF